MPKEVDAAITEFFAGDLWKAVVEGYGQNLDQVDFESPDYAFLEKLQEDVWNFSAAKNYAQLKSLSEALVDENGKLRSFTEFRNQAMMINTDFVVNWLRSEYNFAVAAAQMGARWQQIEFNKEYLPLIQYETAGDERVRLEHQDLEGITLPVDHPFWDTYYPPNGWNCRCTVRQLSTGKVTPESQVSYPDIPKIFQINFGKEKRVFPPGHPYYEGLPETVLNQAQKLRKRNG